MRLLLLLLASAGAMLGSALANELITYTYDEHGRLVKVERTGTINNGVKAEYDYDAADNRTKRKVTGSTNPPP